MRLVLAALLLAACTPSDPTTVTVTAAWVGESREVEVWAAIGETPLAYVGRGYAEADGYAPLLESTAIDVDPGDRITLSARDVPPVSPDGCAPWIEGGQPETCPEVAVCHVMIDEAGDLPCADFEGAIE